jgi:hypothetical protein
MRGVDHGYNQQGQDQNAFSHEKPQGLGLQATALVRLDARPDGRKAGNC